MKKKKLLTSKKTDISRRKALARLGLAVTVAYAIPVVMTISHAEAGGGSGFYGGSRGGSRFHGGSRGGSGWFGGSRGGSRFHGGSRGGSGWFGGSRGGSGWFWWW